VPNAVNRLNANERFHDADPPCRRCDLIAHRCTLGGAAFELSAAQRQYLDYGDRRAMWKIYRIVPEHLPSSHGSVTLTRILGRDGM
jgi:hypothetical protein